MVGADDRIICSTPSNAVGLNVGDRRYVQEARRSWGFILSDYLVERSTNRPAVLAP